MALYLGVANNGTLVSSDGYTLKDSNNLSLTVLPMVIKRKVIINNIVYRVNVKLPKKKDE
jgi:hypothetical protein